MGVELCDRITKTLLNDKTIKRQWLVSGSIVRSLIENPRNLGSSLFVGLLMSEVLGSSETQEIRETTKVKEKIQTIDININDEEGEERKREVWERKQVGADLCRFYRQV